MSVHFVEVSQDQWVNADQVTFVQGWQDGQGRPWATIGLGEGQIDVQTELKPLLKLLREADVINIMLREADVINISHTYG